MKGVKEMRRKKKDMGNRSVDWMKNKEKKE